MDHKKQHYTHEEHEQRGHKQVDGKLFRSDTHPWYCRTCDRFFPAPK